MDLLSLWRIVQVVLGIGLVIFVHEAGHYMAARLCKVRVHVFSLGFGPKLFSWRRGHTEYQVAAVPLGGYVRMAGEESHYSDQPAQPWELGSKTVGQRFFIYSAGVIMNVIFGLVVFPILFAVGIPSTPPVVGEIEPGSPAWMAGVESGTLILEVNGEMIYDLDQVAPEVAYGGTGPVILKVLQPGELEPVELSILPTFDEVYDIYSIGRISAPLEEGLPLTVAEDSPASKAGVKMGDHLLGVAGQTPGLSPQKQLFRAVDAEEPFILAVERGGQELEFVIEPEPGELSPNELIGFTSPFRRLIALLPTDQVSETGLREDDRILSIDGTRVLRPGDLLAALTSTQGPVEWLIEREGEALELVTPELSQDRGIALAESLALSYDLESTRIVVLPGSAAEVAGMRTEDEVLELNGAAVSEYQDLKDASVLAAQTGAALRFSLRRDQGVTGGAQYLELEASPAPLQLMETGLNLTMERYTFRVAGAGEAVKLGVTSSFKMIRDVWRHLRGMMRQEVGKQNVGSIIKISVIAHHTAEIGWVKFFWFLCLLSMNLAFLNVLPIPILDGGHLFFLLIEKIKGSPVSERIFSYSQLVGLVLIVSIFVFVIYNDLSTHVFN
jgi:regulator of sigma E protease